MTLHIDQRSLAEQLLAAPPDEYEDFLASLSEDEAYALENDWQFWGRPAQLMPPHAQGGPDIPWSTWLVLAGRGFGKTRTGTETIRQMVCGKTPLAPGKYSRIAIIAETAADARDVLIEGQSGILRVHPKDFRPVYEPSKRRLTWPNGATATTYNATEPDQLRGPEHDAALCDELAKWAYARETWDMLQFGMRIGAQPRAIVTTTPRPIPLIKDILKDPTTAVTRGSTLDNRTNLAAPFLQRIVTKYAGTRLGRQELDAELLDDVPGALWTRDNLDKNRIKASEVPELQRIVVAVDPSGTDGTDDDKADDIGIVVAGKGINGRGYLLADRTCHLGPSGWGKRAIQAYKDFKANDLIAERNYGGEMVRFVINTADKLAPVRVITATRGKAQRAEPVASLYEQDRISHVDAMPELEDEMCMFTRDGYIGENSPNRADAAVWALTDLLVGDTDYSWETMT